VIPGWPWEQLGKLTISEHSDEYLLRNPGVWRRDPCLGIGWDQERDSMLVATISSPVTLATCFMCLALSFLVCRMGIKWPQGCCEH
jgi:hypothetical protein